MIFLVSWSQIGTRSLIANGWCLLMTPNFYLQIQTEEGENKGKRKDNAGGRGTTAKSKSNPGRHFVHSFLSLVK